jgi:hypothetical protein
VLDGIELSLTADQVFGWLKKRSRYLAKRWRNRVSNKSTSGNFN